MKYFLILLITFCKIVKAQYGYPLILPAFIMEEIQNEKTWFYKKSTEITNCGKTTDAFQYKSLVLDPDPILKNKDLNIKVIGKVIKVIEGGNLSVNIKLGSLTLINKKYTFCSQIEQFNDKCPISIGEKLYTKSFSIPNVPNGIYNIQLNADDILCLKIHVRI
jgi:hypothetical protein